MAHSVLNLILIASLNFCVTRRPYLIESTTLRREICNSGSLYARVCTYSAIAILGLILPRQSERPRDG